MSALDLERIEALLMELRSELLQELSARGGRPLPTLLTLSAAAKELSVGMTKLRELIAGRVVMTVQLGGRAMMPRSELERLSRVDPPKVALTGKAKRLAESLAKVREPVPGAKAAALRVRNANSKRPGVTQDSAALRRRR